MAIRTCPPAPSFRPWHRRLGHATLRALFVLAVVAVLLLAAFTAGQLMLATHTDTDTIHAVAAMSAVVVFLVGLGVTSRSRDRGRS